MPLNGYQGEINTPLHIPKVFDALYALKPNSDKQGHIERLGHVGDGHVVFQQHGQDRPTGRIRKRREDGVEGRGHGLGVRRARAPVNAKAQPMG